MECHSKNFSKHRDVDFNKFGQSSMIKNVLRARQNFFGGSFVEKRLKIQPYFGLDL